MILSLFLLSRVYTVASVLDLLLDTCVYYFPVTLVFLEYSKSHVPSRCLPFPFLQPWSSASIPGRAAVFVVSSTDGEKSQGFL
jgi:hypothetical protein